MYYSERSGKARLTLQCNKTNWRRPFQGFQVNDKVWLEGKNLRLSHPSAKLAAKRYGPFTVSKVISPVVYQLVLPTSWKIFNTFHASLLSPYKEMGEHGPNFMEPPPELIKGAEEYKVESILGQCTYGRWKKKQYLVKWKGYSDAHNSWELAENVNAPELVKEYHGRQPTQVREVTYKRGRKPYERTMPSIPLRISNSELADYNSHYHTDGIQQRLAQVSEEGTPMTTTTTTPHHDALQRKEAPLAALNVASTYHDDPSTPALRPVSPDIPEDIYLEELGELSLAALPCTEELFGVPALGKQRAPSRQGGNSGCAIDEGDLLDHPLGLSGTDLVGAGPTQEGAGPAGPVGGREPGVEEDVELTEVFDLPTLQYLPLADYNPYDFSEGQALHSPANPTLD